jgi:integrase
MANPASEAAWIRALNAWWGDKTADQVKMSTCQAYVEHRTSQPLKAARHAEALAKRVTAEGARRELEVLSSAIGFWTKEYPLSPRPIVTLPQKSEGQRDALTRSQAAALLLAAMGWRRGPGDRWTRLGRSAIENRRHLRRFVLMGLYSGTRPGVLPKLLWVESPTQAWVDLDDGTIYRRGRAEREHRTKRRPLVRIPDRLLAHMTRWKAADDRLNAQLKADGVDQVATVLHHGARALAGRVRTGFEGCVKDAGLDGDVTPHWMRHTCATWLMEAGVPIWDAAAYTGMSTAVLEKNYGHHRPDHQSRARKALDRGAR